MKTVGIILPRWILQRPVRLGMWAYLVLVCLSWQSVSALSVGDKLQIRSRSVHTTVPSDNWGYFYTYLVDPSGREYHETSFLPWSPVAGFSTKDVTLNVAGTWHLRTGTANTNPFKADSIDSDVAIEVTAGGSSDPGFSFTLQVTELDPNPSIDPIDQSIVLGGSASFSLNATDAAPTGHYFSGNNANIPDPGPRVSVVPSTGGEHDYTYSVAGYATILVTVNGVFESIVLQPPNGPPKDVTKLSRLLVVYESGSYSVTVSGPSGYQTESASVSIRRGAASAKVRVSDRPPAPADRSVVFSDNSFTYGSTFNLQSYTNGDGEPVYSVVSGPGSINGNTLTASAVGVVRVQVDYPATATYTAGTAFANVTVVPRPVNFVLRDQDFDFDGAPKAASYSIDYSLAVSDGMVDVSGLAAGPAPGTYTVHVAATGNYSGSASAQVRIFPVAEAFNATPPPAPEIPTLSVPSPVQWPAQGSLEWEVRNAGAVRVADALGSPLSQATSGNLLLPCLDAASPGYTYQVTAEPSPATLTFSQRGATWARLRSPSGADWDVFGQGKWSVTESGIYTYEIGANGLSRSLQVNLTMPSPATRSATMRVTPATVSATWPDRDADGPLSISQADLPRWRIQTGAEVTGGSTALAWRRTDDGVAGSASFPEKLAPGTYVLTASFTPLSANYAPAVAVATWRLTAPLTVSAENAKITYNNVPLNVATVLRILPGTTAIFGASPNVNYDWGLGWDDAHPQIWSGTSGLVPDPSAPLLRVTVPAGIDALTLTASAFQIGPRVTLFTPTAANYTVLTGPAAGRTYPRSWQSDGVWNAYLGRDGVTFNVVGQSRESGIAAFEVEGRPPNGDWQRLAAGDASEQAPNGPRVEVSQIFGVRLGDVNLEKPLVPLDPKLAGTWQIRARVRNTLGTWSAWSPAQSLNVLLPLKSTAVLGRTLPPVQDAEWFTASAMKTYSFQVWVP